MSEQDASVEQAQSVTEHATYAIAARFSERARRAAAEATYVLVQNLVIPDRFTRSLPRADWKGDGRCWCPIGIMLEVDGKRPELVAKRGPIMPEQPTPEDIAYALTGVDLYRSYEGGNANALVEAKHVRDEANDFTRPWDKREINDLAAALGLLPQSADEQTHGDD